MKRFFSRIAVPLVFSSLLVLLLSSCTKVDVMYEKGNYQTVINRINRMTDPTPEDYLLKARSYIAMGKETEAQESLFLYLSTAEEQSAEDRAFAVSHFLAGNNSDRLAAMVLKESDGLDAQIALYEAYARLGDEENASTMLFHLESSLSYSNLISMMLETKYKSDHILDVLQRWYSYITDSEKDDFLSKVVEFSGFGMSESTAKGFLALTDSMMEDSYLIDDNIRLSALLKVKGNILEKLYDKVNAKIYWTQAYRLNPADEELAKRVR